MLLPEKRILPFYASACNVCPQSVFLPAFEGEVRRASVEVQAQMCRCPDNPQEVGEAGVPWAALSSGARILLHGSVMGSKVYKKAGRVGRYVRKRYV